MYSFGYPDNGQKSLSRKETKKTCMNVAMVQSLSYREKFGKLELYSLECRRPRGDCLIEVYNIMRGIDKVRGDRF